MRLPLPVAPRSKTRAVRRVIPRRAMPRRWAGGGPGSVESCQWGHGTSEARFCAVHWQAGARPLCIVAKRAPGPGCCSMLGSGSGLWQRAPTGRLALSPRRCGAASRQWPGRKPSGCGVGGMGGAWALLEFSCVGPSSGVPGPWGTASAIRPSALPSEIRLIGWLVPSESVGAAVTVTATPWRAPGRLILVPLGLWLSPSRHSRPGLSYLAVSLTASKSLRQSGQSLYNRPAGPLSR